MIVKNNDMRLIVIGEFKLLPGNNEVDSKLWDQYKKEYNIDKILASKRLEEIKEVSSELEEKKKEHIKHIENVKESREKLETIEDETEKKAKEKEIKEKEKVIKEEAKELEKLNKEKEFKDFDFQKKQEIIENTYNLKTLEAWELTEPDTAIRVKIEKRIQGIVDKKIKEKYGKPENHV